MTLNKSILFSIFSVTALLISILNASCSGSGSGDEEGGGGSPAGNVILPLEVGNTWTHTWDTGVIDPYDLTTSVSEIQIISGNDTYKTGTAALYNFYRNHDDGLYKYGSNLGILSAPCLYLKYPCSVGDTWTFDGGTFTVINTSVTASVDAGAFECVEYYYYKVNADSTICQHYEFWAPGYGQIIQDVYLDGVLQVSIELKSYFLN